MKQWGGGACKTGGPRRGHHTGVRRCVCVWFWRGGGPPWNAAAGLQLPITSSCCRAPPRPASSRRPPWRACRCLQQDSTGQLQRQRACAGPGGRATAAGRQSWWAARERRAAGTCCRSWPLTHTSRAPKAAWGAWRRGGSAAAGPAAQCARRRQAPTGSAVQVAGAPSGGRVGRRQQRQLSPGARSPAGPSHTCMVFRSGACWPQMWHLHGAGAHPAAVGRGTGPASATPPPAAARLQAGAIGRPPAQHPRARSFRTYTWRARRRRPCGRRGLPCRRPRSAARQGRGGRRAVTAAPPHVRTAARQAWRMPARPGSSGVGPAAAPHLQRRLGLGGELRRSVLGGLGLAHRAPPLLVCLRGSRPRPIHAPPKHWAVAAATAGVRCVGLAHCTCSECGCCQGAARGMPAVGEAGEEGGAQAELQRATERMATRVQSLQSAPGSHA